MAYKKLILKPKRDYALSARHCWIFSGALEQIPKDLAEGELVQVFSAERKPLAVGYYSTQGSIAVKILSFKEEPIDTDFFVRKFSACLKLREELGLAGSTETNCFRLVNAEGDGLAGLIADYYNGTVVLQCQALGMLKLKEHIAQALLEVFGSELKSIYLKTADEANSLSPAYLHGDPRPVIARENGLQFKIDIERGQKTGLFLDQRDNRALLQSLARGKRVLNTFCYTGGFSLSALRAGASYVESIDSSQRALDMLEENLELNDFHKQNRHRSTNADVMQYLGKEPLDFDLIILDPPAFVKHKKALQSGLKGYTNLHQKTFSALKKETLLLSFSCSQLVSTNDFKSAVFQAAISARKDVQILKELKQAPCHPISLFHPESDYLKGLLLWVREL